MNNLIDEGLGKYVEKTKLTRKLSLNGISKVYPVYRVRLDKLYYNDQNDRIATWISQYKNEHGNNIFNDLSRDEYNSIIEKFIIQSNETAIEKTQMNIALVHQREPGVVLSDGRVIDGNRRFTCLRRLSITKPEFNWFETVILKSDADINKKQIKMLELAIQYGEEKKVDYNIIDRIVGTYQDIIETRLLTLEEYAHSTNETESEVGKRLENAVLLLEFLDYINMPKQWHIAREYQVISAFTDLQSLLKKCSTIEMRKQIKNAFFLNIFMRTAGDSKKYIRNLGSMISNGLLPEYLKEQEILERQLKIDLYDANPKNKNELEFFVSTHEDIAESLELSLDRSLLRTRKQETRNRPSKIVSRSILLLKDIDTNIFKKLTDLEREDLIEQLNRLSKLVNSFETIMNNDNSEENN